jgi:RND superfamily putative drug exporter
MFRSLGAFIYRRRWLTLVFAGIFLLASVAALFFSGRLSGGTVRGLEADRADALVASVVGRSPETTFVVLFHSDQVAPSTPEFEGAMARALAPLRLDDRVTAVEAPSDLDPRTAATRVNKERKTAYALVTLKGEANEALAVYPAVRDTLSSDSLQVLATGKLPFMSNLNVQLEKDLLLAELISLPLALFVLLLVFRTGVAAVLPVGVGALSVAGGIAIVFGLSHVTDISQYTVNVCSLIGLGVAIDYSLFTVSRYREELAAGHDYPEALARAVDNAGRVVAFSGLAVGSGLAGLLFFDGSYLMTMGIGGTIVVGLAALFALTFLPALLAVLGPRIHALRLPLPDLHVRGGFWHGVSTWVMRRPLQVLVPTLALLLLLASPFLKIRLAASDVRVLPDSLEARRGFELLRTDFADDADTHFTVAVKFPTPELTPERVGALHDLSARIAAMPDVRVVRSLAYGDPRLSREAYQAMLTSPPQGEEQAQLIAGAKAAFWRDDVVFLQAISASQPDSDAARAVVKAIRADRQVADGTLVVGGESATDVDTTDYLLERAPRAVGFVVGATLLVLFLLLGSVLLPIKAVLMNFLSIGGAFGALVFIFQEGHGISGGGRPLEPALPVLLFCVLFGLSMDYEVLILTRMKEAWGRTHDNTKSVGEGLELTGGLVTSAAAIMVAVFIAFAFAKVVLIQAVGVGMAIAVALDATLVRVLLVPATMRLFGDANWWAPRWLQAVRRAMHLEHEGESDEQPPRADPPPRVDPPPRGTLSAT